MSPGIFRCAFVQQERESYHVEQDDCHSTYCAMASIWLGVGGTPQSFARAGALGLPLMVAIIGGEPRRFRPLIDLYRETGELRTFTG
jgi:alkanesulfonate monooxygenase SsuD/methylene tetrahydromethanopterin reductase-like flavin-dependent oxidoreductase (luciferase family)